jgi:folate-binding protein YgfZ
LLGQPGVFLATARTQLARLWRELIAASVYPAGAAAFHACRIEAGFPLYGIDLSENNLAQEAARTDIAISFTKGCYLGQEPIVRIDALGHVNREVRGLRLESAPTPEPGDAVLSDQGREVGVITSSALVPGEDRPIALGLLRSSHATPGTEVRVRIGDTQIGASVFWSRRA